MTERLLFNRISVFRGGFTLNAVEAVSGEPIEGSTILHLPTSLVEKSIIVVDTRENLETRYRMLETLLLSHYSLELGFHIHIRKTEQNKVKEFRQISSAMTFKEDFGIASEKAFKKIKEIDLLILQDHEIPAASEVTTSIDTAREAINDRFRDLFTILPNTKITAFVIVKDSDYQKAMDMLNSAANKKDKLLEKIRIIKIGYLTKENFKSLLS